MLLRQRQRELQALVDRRTQELQASHRQMERLAFRDPLTELGNRRQFNETLRQLRANHARSGGVFGLLLLDLDKFKPVNDTHGHDAGDAVLVEVARRLAGAVREGDLVARLGGDEFGVLLEGIAGREAARAAVQRIEEALAAPIRHGELALVVGASAGLALYPEDGAEVEALFKRADDALYRAKERRG